MLPSHICSSPERSTAALFAISVSPSDCPHRFRFNLERSGSTVDAACCCSPVAEPYDLACLYLRSHDNAMRYTSSGVFVDRHSSFCASLLFMSTMNTSRKILVSTVQKMHRAASPLKTE